MARNLFGEECGSKYADRQQNIKSAKAYTESFCDDLLGKSNNVKKIEN